MDHVVTRISKIFESLVGCKMDFQKPSEIQIDMWAEQDLATLMGKVVAVPRFIEANNGTTFGFPITIQGTLKGLAVVNGMDGARTPKLMMLAELLAAVMEQSARNEDRAERLRFIEERMIIEDESSNVIPLRPAHFESVMQVTDVDGMPDPLPSPLTTTPLLIESKPGYPLSRVAIEIHQTSKRWAFVMSDDLPKDVFESRESIKELGPVTLFIKDLSTLDLGQQIKLAEYLSTQPDSTMPHVIAGVETPVKDLEHDGKLFPLLVKLFCVAPLAYSDKSPAEVTRELVKASLRHILEQSGESHVVGQHVIPFNPQYLDPDQQSFH